MAPVVVQWLLLIGAILAVALLVVAWAMAGPGSLHARFTHEVAARTRAVQARGEAPVVTDDDLVRVPEPVRRYLRAAGVVGQPRPRAYRLTFSGRIRGGPDEAWMPFRAEQYSEVDGPVRLFYLKARRGGIPVAVLHRYVEGRATMTVKLAGLVRLVDARGAVMDRSETVTVLNDMCLLAPGTLLDPRITFRVRDAYSVEATFAVKGETVAAALTFGPDGLLANFESHDRSRASADGRTFTALPFLTPVNAHGTFAGVLLARHAFAQWRIEGNQLFTYAEFTVESATFDATALSHEPEGAGKK
jgi:hypothetical protein